jgi:hypothetical protein
MMIKIYLWSLKKILFNWSFISCLAIFLLCLEYLLFLILFQLSYKSLVNLSLILAIDRRYGNLKRILDIIPNLTILMRITLLGLKSIKIY